MEDSGKGRSVNIEPLPSEESSFGRSISEWTSLETTRLVASVLLTIKENTTEPNWNKVSHVMLQQPEAKERSTDFYSSTNCALQYFRLQVRYFSSDQICSENAISSAEKLLKLLASEALSEKSKRLKILQNKNLKEQGEGTKDLGTNSHRKNSSQRSNPSTSVSADLNPDTIFEDAIGFDSVSQEYFQSPYEMKRSKMESYRTNSCFGKASNSVTTESEIEINNANNRSGSPNPATQFGEEVITFNLDFEQSDSFVNSDVQGIQMLSTCGKQKVTFHASGGKKRRAEKRDVLKCEEKMEKVKDFLNEAVEESRSLRDKTKVKVSRLKSIGRYKNKSDSSQNPNQEESGVTKDTENNNSSKTPTSVDKLDKKPSSCNWPVPVCPTVTEDMVFKLPELPKQKAIISEIQEPASDQIFQSPSDPDEHQSMIINNDDITSQSETIRQWNKASECNSNTQGHNIYRDKSCNDQNSNTVVLPSGETFIENVRFINCSENPNSEVYSFVGNEVAQNPTMQAPCYKEKLMQVFGRAIAVTPNFLYNLSNFPTNCAITEPMDLLTIKRNLEENRINTFEKLMRDVYLIYFNAFMIFSDDHPNFIESQDAAILINEIFEEYKAENFKSAHLEIQKAEPESIISKTKPIKIIRSVSPDITDLALPPKSKRHK